MGDGEMEKEDSGSKDGVDLVVKKSPISGSGIARVHVSVLPTVEVEEGKPALLRHGNKERVVRLVADEMMDEGKVSLRQKDLDKLQVKAGGTVTLLPLKGVGSMLGINLKPFRRGEKR